MSGALAQNIQLTLETSRVEASVLANGAIAVVVTENHERLEDRGFLAASRRTEDGSISRDLTPAEDAKSKLARDLGESGLVALELNRIVCFEEYIANSVLAWLREKATEVPLRLALEKPVRDASHDTSTVSVSTIRTSRPSMRHGAQKLSGIGYNFVSRFTLGKRR